MRNNFEHKALLILDNAPGHSPNLDDLSDNVQVIFLPPNTTCLIQPMDQGGYFNIQGLLFTAHI